MGRPKILPAEWWPACADPAKLFAAVGPIASDRKHLLFAVAWHLTCPPSPERRQPMKRVVRPLLQVERYADGEYPRDGLSPLWEVWVERPGEWAEGCAAGRQAGFSLSDEVATRLIRCVYPNPFRPIVVETDWRTPAVLALAEGIYADRAWDRLPILADALDDAGCTHPDVIGHLRGPGPHARGCWVVDLILGRS